MFVLYISCSGRRSTDYKRQVESFNQTVVVNGQEIPMNVITDFKKVTLFYLYLALHISVSLMS